ncbi:hypothetical protein N559_4465 [Klebsiella pneumoniae JM45]|nr:hypothetical protein N559_4465 [Klebsiella pneumoniae JM45]
MGIFIFDCGHFQCQSSSSPLQTTIRAQGSVKRTTVNRGVTSDSEEEMKLSSKKAVRNIDIFVRSVLARFVQSYRKNHY